MIIRKFGDGKPKIVIFQGSPRDQDTCPGMQSKTQKIIDFLVDEYSYMVDFVVIDLSVNQNKRPIIQPCKGCVSTAGGYHCHWQCDCYSKGSKNQPDLLKELDVYSHLESCSAFIVFSPIHWYSVSSQVKALFDRLVCANQTLTHEQAIDIMGKGNIKNSKITGPMSESGEHDHLLKNHLSGKYGAFYLHGDNGANDYEKNAKPKSLKDHASEEKMISDNTRLAVMPIVMQCRYSGIIVPDDLIKTFHMNEGDPYYTSNSEFIKNMKPFESASDLLDRLLGYL